MGEHESPRDRMVSKPHCTVQRGRRYEFYIGLDACDMKGKWKGVVVAAITVDGNN
jgi:hypothetical protein